MMLQDADGQVLEAHSASAGLDYPGVGPQIAALAAAGRVEVQAATDDEAFEAMRWLSRAEGILPALESAHALAVLPRLLAGAGGSELAGPGTLERPAWPEEAVVLVGLSGRGDKDLLQFGRWIEEHEA
jgi:tryptophan synthase beta chain